MNLRAVIFDFDGVVVDTEPLHHQAFAELYASRGAHISWDTYCTQLIGCDDRDALREISRLYHLPLNEKDLPALIDLKAELYLELLNRQIPTPLPGVLPLLESLRAEDIPLALCSGALASDIDPVWARWDLGAFFHVRVTADDVHRSKPHPASYQLALERLQDAFPADALEPHTTVAIEDTAAGATSASEAGLSVLGVHPSPDAGLSRRAHRIVPSLDGCTPIDLDRLLQSGRTP